MRSNLKTEAIARIRGGEGAPNLRGTVCFYQRRGCVLLEVRVTGLPKSETGFFALHIHEGDSCGENDFADTGGHFNPQNCPHPRHAGDLPPLLSNGGNAWMAVRTDRFTLREIIGKTVVIHDGPDDFRSQPAGDSGRKIACGVIRSC